MTLFRFMALCWASLPRTTGMTMKQPVAASAPLTAGGENAMANTYGFLRTASNNVGNTVEGVLGVEGSLTDMKKDLDQEYERWVVKKKALLGDRDKLKSEKSRLTGSLLEQKEMREEKNRVEGNVATQKAENEKIAAANKEAEAKRQFERKGMEEDIDALKCATKAIQQAQQVKVDAANKKTAVLKDQNRLLQEQVFKMNKDVNTLVTSATTQKINNKQDTSVLLAQVESLQQQIHGLEKQLVAQAQLEETVERARERMATQSSETVKQREKLTQAQAQCMQNKKDAVNKIEAAKSALSGANAQMMQCQTMDGENQKLQTELNQCIARKRSLR